ncbi:MAG: hypothetical protein IJG43_04905 [Acidaminococcaceae bacterium]|nr:hypothetical protein [Acidaminococcaceae bacterium]
MPVNRNEITKAQMLKAVTCKTAVELQELAKAEGYDITKEEAEAYFAEISDMELDSEKLKQIAGGIETCYAVDGCSWH